MIDRLHQAPVSGWPVTTALVKLTTGVSGAIQLMFCTMGEKPSRGKNRPLKKNMGVRNSVK